MATATLTLTANVPTGLKYTTLIDPNISDTPSIAFGQSPTVVSTDMVIFHKWATKDGVTTSYSVTISTNGMPTVFSMSDSSSLSFQYFFWDESTSAYGTTATFSVLEYSTGGGVTPLAVGNIWQWFFQTETSTGGMTDKIKIYLAAQGYTGATNEALFNWLGSLGYTGALADRISQFERANTTRYG